MSSTVVLLHGFTNTGHSWDGVIDSLPDCDSLAPDLRGHGDRGDARPITLDAVIDDVAALAPDTFTLVGYSMGGRIALHTAFALHDRVRRLILVGASPGLRTATARAERRASDERWQTNSSTRRSSGSPNGGRARRRSPTSRPRSGPGPMPIGGATTARPGWPRLSAGSGPARCRRCGLAWTGSRSRSC